MKTKHITAKEGFLFSLNEMSPRDLKRIGAHLSTCETCRERLRQDERMIHLFKGHPAYEVKEESVERARRLLQDRLRMAERGIPARRDFGWIESIFIPRSAQKFAVAAIVFFAGVGAGHFGLPTISSKSRSVSADVRALTTRAIPANIQIETNEADPGQVEIRFQSIEDHVLRGRLDDHNIQEALGFALLWAPKDNIRLAALNKIASAPKVPVFEEALLSSAENDRNPGVRLKALQVLNTFPVNDGIKQMLIRTFLNEPHSGIRIEAVNGLSRIADASTLSLIQQKADEDPYVRYRWTQMREYMANAKPKKSDS